MSRLLTSSKLVITLGALLAWGSMGCNGEIDDPVDEEESAFIDFGGGTDGKADTWETKSVAVKLWPGQGMDISVPITGYYKQVWLGATREEMSVAIYGAIQSLGADLKTATNKTWPNGEVVRYYPQVKLSGVFQQGKLVRIVSFAERSHAVFEIGWGGYGEKSGADIGDLGHLDNVMDRVGYDGLDIKSRWNPGYATREYLFMDRHYGFVYNSQQAMHEYLDVIGYEISAILLRPASAQRQPQPQLHLPPQDVLLPGRLTAVETLDLRDDQHVIGELDLGLADERAAAEQAELAVADDLACGGRPASSGAAPSTRCRTRSGRGRDGAPA